jgi:hypothetical protein
MGLRQRARRAIVRIALASFSTACLRVSKRVSVIEKVKPINNASRASIEACNVVISADIEAPQCRRRATPTNRPSSAAARMASIGTP